MIEAIVGDDVLGEDETVIVLQKLQIYLVWSLLFVPSGVMSNQSLKVLIAWVKLLSRKIGYIYNYETGGLRFYQRQFQTVTVICKLAPQDLINRKRGFYDWEPDTSVLSLENIPTKVERCYSQNELMALTNFSKKKTYITHRWCKNMECNCCNWNKPSFFGQIADTISVCFSKGLGAPVGSMLLSTSKRIAQARRYLKMWGGGMRQVGLLAAAADYAVDNHWSLMENDHKSSNFCCV